MSTDDNTSDPNPPATSGGGIHVGGDVTGMVAQGGPGSSISMVQNATPATTQPVNGPATTVAAPPSGGSRAWFDDLPLDWTREDTRRAHALLVQAYPMNYTALVLAQNSGLDVASINQQLPPNMLMREILAAARMSDRLPQLLAQVLTDPTVAAIHQPLSVLSAGQQSRIREAALARSPSIATLAMLPSAVELWGSGDQEPRTIADPAEFEKTINAAAGFADIHVFRARLAEAEARTARVEVRGKARGTGFLIGDRYLLTNWHVVKDADSDGCLARFDHVTPDSAGTTLDGRPVAFAADWLVAKSFHDDKQAELSPDGPTVGTLDFALVRLTEPVGAQGIGPDPLATEGGVRGHYLLDGGAYDFQNEEPVLIVGHPSGRPMQLSYASPAHVRTTKYGNRIRYSTNTEAGSSGSPVFNRDWRIVGLHHAAGPTRTPGELDQPSPGFNQGIPIPLLVAELRDQLAGRSELGELGLV